MKYCGSCQAKYDDSVSFCTVDGEVLEDDPSSLVNTVLDGQYQMEALLGKGGMGAVYRARHILLGDRVAIKVLPPEVRSNAEWLRRFRREGQAARRFRHANAVTVYDLRTAADGTIYMVMEYVEGHTLDAELKKKGKLNAREALELLTPVMSVLETAHAMGVVHRDLKPENIMVGNPTGNGEPVIKLLDLGIAKMREIAGVDTSGNTALTMAGQVLGTPYYMSPEQWGEIPRDENLEIDGRADIYSLGLVFYELIAGRRCFSGNTLHELRREHVGTRPRPLKEVVPSVPQGFSDAIERATAKDRGDRQPSAGVLAEELRAALSTLPATGDLKAGEFAETVALPNRLETNSDVNAPTILTLDAAQTAPPPGGPSSTSPGATHPVPNAPVASDTIVELAPAPSIVTQVPRVTPPQPQIVTPSQPQIATPPQSKSKAGLLIGGVVLLFLVLAGGIGGYLIWNRTKTPPVVGPTNTSTNGKTTEVTPREVSKYWLELESSAPSTRVAGLVPIASGTQLKMHFVFDEDGYVYVFGPGDGNKLTAFLTSKPHPASGLQSNAATRGVDFSFPRGKGNSLTLDKNPGTDNFTVIFSKSPLVTPTFFADAVTGDPMSASQQAEFKSFITKNQEKQPITELDESNPKEPFVRVKVSPTQTGNPIVFDIRIQHN